MKISRHHLKKIVEAYMGPLLQGKRIHTDTDSISSLSRTLQDRPSLDDLDGEALERAKEALRKVGPPSKTSLPVQKKVGSDTNKKRWAPEWEGEVNAIANAVDSNNTKKPDLLPSELGEDFSDPLLDVKPTTVVKTLGDAFPDSNVWVQGLGMSSKEFSSKILGKNINPNFKPKDLFAKLRDMGEEEYAFYYYTGGDVDLTDEDAVNIASNVPDFEINRTQIKPISDPLSQHILKSIGMTKETESKINNENDIIFLALVTSAVANFTLTPWLLIHALVDTRSIKGQYRSEIDKIVSEGAKNWSELLMKKHGIFGFDDVVGEDLGNVYNAIARMITTKAGREKKVFTIKDAFTEMVVQEITNSMPKGESIFKFSEKYLKSEPGVNVEKEAYQSLSDEDKEIINKVLNDVKTTAARIRDYLKGKLVVIDHV